MGKRLDRNPQKSIRLILKKTYWKFLRYTPRGLKDIVKATIEKYPYLRYPISFLRVIWIMKAKIGKVKGVIIYPPTVDWSWMKQRPHQLIEGLSQKGYLCFYANNNQKGMTGGGYFKKINKNLYIIGNPYILFKIKNPILLIGWTEHYKFINKFNNPIIIYDYLDDLSVSAVEIDKEKLDHHKYFLKNSNIVLVTADLLEEDALRYRKEIIKLPNAGNYDDFHLTKKPPIPKDLKVILNRKKPIIGYYGALAKWFDYDLVKDTASKLPNHEFVLIGPDYDESIHAHHLDQITNVHWLGIKDYIELPKYLYYFDVAMIPFLINDITRATSPVKIFEYMAGGKLTVSTPLNECKKYRSVLIGDRNNFSEKIKEGLVLSKRKKYQQIANKEALENTWDSRVEQIITALKNIDKNKLKEE